jgi:uncharacterized protein YabE (DUF348 family)/3D (Asp-Asp-Asp) domain-containing protein
MAIPIARTHATQRASSPAAISRTGDGFSEELRLQAAGVTAELAGAQPEGSSGELSAAHIEPPLGSGLFPETLLAAAARLAANGGFPSPGTKAALEMARQNPVRFTVHEDGFSTTHSSTQLTVGQALAGQGVRVGEGDFVAPAPDSELAAGAHIYISHAVGVRLVVAGGEQQLKTRGQTVKDVLAQAGIGLQPLDRVTPRPGKAIRSGMTIRVTTVRGGTEVVEESIGYASVTQYDAELARGQRIISQGGTNGSVRREYRVRQVNGRETRRELVNETVVPPTDEVVTIGTYVKPAAPAPVVAAAVAAPAGDLGCARTLHVYATWYTAASAGDGTTATGTGVYKGIVAVDPRVIPLGTRMYIPGYGYGIAADTGGGVFGNYIDLAYGPDDVKDWRTRWVDICIL